MVRKIATRSGIAFVLSMSLFLSGCADGGIATGHWTTASISPPPANDRPQDEAVAQGKLQYRKGSYGLAERSFRAAVEANASSFEGWLGLAASYDQLRRFDLAERAYNEAIGLQGRTVGVLNNLAYHHMLRGDLQKAGRLLEEAAQKEPDNPVVAGNFRLLETWKSGAPEVATVYR